MCLCNKTRKTTCKKENIKTTTGKIRKGSTKIRKTTTGEQNLRYSLSKKFKKYF